MAEVHPGVRDADVVVHSLNAAVQVYPAAVVLHVVHRDSYELALGGLLL